MACDLAEVLGAAIALNLLFSIPLLAGVLITAADTLLVLWLQRFGIRLVEAIVLSLIAIIAACFCIEIFLAHPNPSEVVKGLLPRLSSESLYIVIGILGATVMPHNLYLHSALVQTRRIGTSPLERRIACRYNLIDSVIALNGAMLVNAAILVMAAAVFFKHSIVVTEIQQAHLLLAPLMGTTVAGVVFAIALLCSGQSSTLTGTLAGQIVMEGFPGCPPAALAAAPDHAQPGHRAGRRHHLFCRRPQHVPVAAAQPGRAQHATALRGDSADSFHQRPQTHGQFRQ